ncbi:MAG: hypothetical protein D6675_12145 [Gemmatimonadetes bacterium]|nr:MAG: hypothetical protein D6675_12145 [Gemmatimonadota bacterium]
MKPKCDVTPKAQKRKVMAYFALCCLILTPWDNGWTLDYTYNGYLKILPRVAYDRDWKEPTFDALVHNRLNFKWYANLNWTAAVEIRNRAFGGNSVKENPFLAEMLEKDTGYVDLSTVWLEQDNLLIHTMVDRLWCDYYRDNLQVRIGRQRVNWGINLVWNPHDLFNTYSYADFDYEERPGTDGVRVQYYTGIASKIETAIRLAEAERDQVYAGLVQLNRWNYDFQIIGGQYLQKQWVAGFGWAGDIRGGGFRGEFSYFIPQEKAEGAPYLVGALSADYTFSNSLYVHLEALYNERGTTKKAGGALRLDPLPANQLSRARHSLFGEMRYQFSPLVTGTMAMMMNPHDKSFLASPALAWSAWENWDVLLISQFYRGEPGTEFGDTGNFVYARLKWSF